MIIPIVSSGIAFPAPPVPQTTIPSPLAAATSMEALRIPVVISSSRFGNRSRIEAGKAVRSRIATTTALPASRSTSSSVPVRCSVMTSRVKWSVTGAQSA